ncbi:MAG: DNA repair protein RecN [Betaproteobacteria bacterium]|jgi:DNA repair protein RecN|nr:DNA repair protein RecN [Betaproteobacteria bacterium]
MLTRLCIHHFVLVEHLDLEWQNGFTALTGETGAGKSILLDALELVLGGRADPSVVRPGAERANLVAHFEPAPTHPARAWLSEQELTTPENECLLRRVVEKSGKSRAFINGTPVTATQLRELGELLIDIHGQHAHQHLLHSQAQRDCLDTFGQHLDLVTLVRESWQAWQIAQDTLIHAQQAQETRQAQRIALQEQLDWLSPLKLTDQSWDNLQQDHQRWSHHTDLLNGIGTILDTLDEQDQAVRRQLLNCQHQLSELACLDPTLATFSTLLESARIEVEEVSTALERYRSGHQDQEDRLPELEIQLQDWLTVARRLHCRPQDLPERAISLRQELATLNADADLTTLQQRAQDAQRHWIQVRERLTQQRQKAAQRLSQEVTSSLASLALGQARFAAVLIPLSEPSSGAAERIEFQFSAHPSQPLAALQRVASGGELARLGLALQTRLSQDTHVSTLIFDEVDSGIGGAVAQRVGQLLAELGQRHQVLCVTHLAQVAAAAHHHCSVHKCEIEGRMQSQVTSLDYGARIEEIARMLGGITLTDTVRQHARELLAHTP